MGFVSGRRLFAAIDESMRELGTEDKGEAGKNETASAKMDADWVGRSSEGRN